MPDLTSKRTTVYGVWGRGHEGDHLFGLYATPQAAEAHLAAASQSGKFLPDDIEEHVLHEDFTGIGPYGHPKEA